MINFKDIPEKDIKEYDFNYEVISIRKNKKIALENQEYEKAMNLRFLEREIIEKLYDRKNKLKRILNT